MADPVELTPQLIDLLTRAITAFERHNDLLEREIAIKDRAETRMAFSARERIRRDRASAAYHQNDGDPDKPKTSEK